MEWAGLTSEEVEERRAHGKVNDYDDRSSRGYLEILIKNLLTPFNVVLFILAIALYVVNENRLNGIVNALSACGVVAFNVLISTFQEFRAKRRLDKIAVLMRPKVTVVRNGEDVVIDKDGIVIDDVVHMSSGDQAQVDGTVLSERSSEMDESLLTGESSTVRKHDGDIIYSGSYCISGEVWFKVESVGADTYSAKMLSNARKFEKKKTPLQTETNAITAILMSLAAVFLLILVVRNLIFRESISSTLAQAIIVLDIVPIALFLLITLTYMIAAVRMADSGALLQDSSSVESMSHVDTVCMDKTGTITTNNLIYEESVHYKDEAEESRLVRLFVGATGSRNRTVTALENHFGKEDSELVDEIQFSSDRKFSAVRVKTDDGYRTIVMGAWTVLKDNVRGNVQVDKVLGVLSSKGLRSLVFCDGGDSTLHDGADAVLPELDLVSIISIRDEVRPDCRRILEQFTDNGMDIKVISGDNPDTVAAIFKLAGIPGEKKTVSGRDLENMEDEEYSRTIIDTDIFGRMRPEQKEKVIKTLRDNGRYVAYVGDGVNDVRSIKKAQVGVSVQSGSGAARGVADIVLMNDDFSALPQAIVEGKKTVSGMRDILRLYLTRNCVIAMLVTFLLLLCWKSPLLPVQNTTYALLTVSFAAFLMTIWAKPSENKDLILPKVMRYVLPTALTLSIFALGIYTTVYLMVDWGMVSLDGLIDRITEDMINMGIWTTPDDFWSTFSTDKGRDMADVVARNAMLLFLFISGISQLYLLFPMTKGTAYDGKVNRDIKIVLLSFMLFGVLVLLYNVETVCVAIAALLPFPLEWWAALIAVSAIWFGVTVKVLKFNRMDWIEDKTDELVRRQLSKDLDRESVEETDGQ